MAKCKTCLHESWLHHPVTNKCQSVIFGKVIEYDTIMAGHKTLCLEIEQAGYCDWISLRV